MPMRVTAIRAICTLLGLLVAGDSCARAVFAASTDAGAAAIARLYDGQTYTAPIDLSPFASFTGGARVACGDVNVDGQADLIVGAGAGGTPQIKIYSGRNGALLDDYLAFSAAFGGGVYVAAGDVDGDGHADVIVGAGSTGGPFVKAFSGLDHSLLKNFYAFSPSFIGGVRVAGGDVNGDGHADIIAAAGPGGTPEVRIFDGVTGSMIDDFLAFAPTFSGGIYVAAADLDGDGAADIIVGADAGGAPTVAVFSGVGHQSLGSFNAFAVAFAGGVRVGAGDVNGDGTTDIVVATGVGAGEVKVLSWPSLTTINDFTPFGAAFASGVFVAGPAPDDAIFGDGFDS
jgi:FG-GAP-like repeat/FG-GAP repeat